MSLFTPPEFTANSSFCPEVCVFRKFGSMSSSVIVSAEKIMNFSPPGRACHSFAAKKKQLKGVQTSYLEGRTEEVKIIWIN